MGHISKPLTEELVQKGHVVTVISSKAERRKEIEAMNAKGAIGSMEDPAFLTETFKGADVVYVMEALATNSFFDPNLDVIAAISEIGNSYKLAIQQSGVKRIVHLSSIGAHTDKGSGILAFHYHKAATAKLTARPVTLSCISAVVSDVPEGDFDIVAKHRADRWFI